MWELIFALWALQRILWESIFSVMTSKQISREFAVPLRHCDFENDFSKNSFIETNQKDNQWSRDHVIQKALIWQQLQFLQFINFWKLQQELIFAIHQFWNISRELIFAISHFWGSEKEYNFLIVAKNCEICEIFFPHKFFPLTYFRVEN